MGLTEQPLPGLRSSFVEDVNGLRMHILEAGFEEAGRPALLLLHGFPELAYSWRKVMGPLAEAGYRVIAPDQRGYGRTTGWDPDYDGDLAPFRMTNLVRDQLALLARLEIGPVAAVIGHDFGSFVAAHCALIRPDVFPAVALMSAPYEGPPAFPSGGAEQAKPVDIDAELGKLARPRKHYQLYYGTREANGNMWRATQGLAAFLRAYFHHKSGDWAGNEPYRLEGWTAEELAKMPTYYIMERDLGMAETVAPFMPSEEEVEACAWLTEADLAVYAGEYGRTGFQGGLQWYRCTYDPGQIADLRLFSGGKIEVPACYIAGARDWGVYQKPGALEAMQNTVCRDFRGLHLVPGAGHWVQQEAPEAVVSLLLEFLGQT